MADDFDAASFASRALAETHTTPQAQTEQLQAGITLLDEQLRAEVSARKSELFGQAARLQESEAALQRITLSVRSLQSVAARVRAEVAEPYRQIAAKSVQLRNLQRTVDLLRHVIHRLKLVQKLRAQMAMESGGARRGGVCGGWWCVEGAGRAGRARHLGGCASGSAAPGPPATDNDRREFGCFIQAPAAAA